MKQEAVSARFIETISMRNALSWKLMSPRLHHFSCALEVVIQTASLDDAITVFLRRVLEDVHAVTESSSALSSSLQIITDNFRHNHVLDTTSAFLKGGESRQELLRSLTNAVTSLGTIELQFYLRRSDRTLPVYISQYENYRTPSTGYIKIKRQYRLTFQQTLPMDMINTSNTSTDNIRSTICYVSNPLHGLATSLFTSLNDAQFYLSAYLAQDVLKPPPPPPSAPPSKGQRNKAKKGSSSTTTTSSSSDGARRRMVNKEPTTLVRLISYQARLVCNYLKKGELVDMFEAMLLLQTLLEGDHFQPILQSPEATTQPQQQAVSFESLSYPIIQLSFALKSSASHWQALRDACSSLLGAVRILEGQVVNCTDGVFRPTNSNSMIYAAISPSQQRLLGHLSVLPNALAEVRQLLQELGYEPNHVSLVYTQHDLFEKVLRLFDNENPALCLLPATVVGWRRLFQTEALCLLRHTYSIIDGIQLALKSLTTNLLSEFVGYLLGKDLLSYALYQETLRAEESSRSDSTVNSKVSQSNTLPYGRVAGDKDPQLLPVRRLFYSFLDDERDFKDVPRCFLDLLSYACYQAQYQVTQQTQKTSPVLQYSWRVLKVHPAMKEENDAFVSHFVFQQPKSLLPSALKATYKSQEESYALQKDFEERLERETFYLQYACKRPHPSPRVSMFWDYFGYLGSYNTQVYGGIQRPALQVYEAYARAMPRSILTEASLIRYLTQSHLLPIVSQAVFEMQYYQSKSSSQQAMSTRIFWQTLFPLLSRATTEDAWRQDLKEKAILWRQLRRRQLQAERLRHRRSAATASGNDDYLLLNSSEEKKQLMDHDGHMQEEKDHSSLLSRTAPEIALEDIFGPCRHNHIQPLLLHGATTNNNNQKNSNDKRHIHDGPFYLQLPREALTRAYSPTSMARHLTGALVANDRVLLVLGTSAPDLWAYIWCLPALLPRVPTLRTRTRRSSHNGGHVGVSARDTTR